MPTANAPQPEQVFCKRAYDDPADNDGYRVLVDRMWPRGVSKDALQLDDWQKALAPSTELRQWFGHDPQRWAGFYQKFHKELEQNAEAVEAIDNLLKVCNGRTLTLIYAARDEQHNNAVALKRYLDT
ncbi:MAG: DUF488 domain-containing protein [Halomonas sp.]|nr:DUF488 domain-containing protein [Halomonas sp.]MDN6296887.1 DUF488 domain-containing protein [Halomonas sp.]MDN6314395.1 DUF488 domain-containing protein [Halomonas sp.]MDN6335645.1 DUF488 domain-containing protein [Halomonas sp.]